MSTTTERRMEEELDARTGDTDASDSDSGKDVPTGGHVVADVDQGAETAEDAE